MGQQAVALTQAPELNTHRSHGSWSAESRAGPFRARERDRAEPRLAKQQVPLPGGQSGRAGGRKQRGRLGVRGTYAQSTRTKEEARPPCPRFFPDRERPPSLLPVGTPAQSLTARPFSYPPACAMRPGAPAAFWREYDGGIERTCLEILRSDP